MIFGPVAGLFLEWPFHVRENFEDGDGPTRGGGQASGTARGAVPQARAGKQSQVGEGPDFPCLHPAVLCRMCEI
jgi:hypothetical protein